MITSLVRVWKQKVRSGAAMAILIALSAILLMGCGLMPGGDAEAAEETQASDGPLPTLLPTNTPPPPTPTPTPEPTLTPTPVAQNPDEARNLVWVHLSRCVTLDFGQLEAYMVKGDWFVRATNDSPQKYGFWKVQTVSGGLEPHDNLARDWDSFVSSHCNAAVFDSLATPTPVPMAPTPVPPPEPVINEAADAVIALWAYLIPCYPFLPTNALESSWNPAEGTWVVRTKADTSPDYRVWTIDSDGSIDPQNNSAAFRVDDVISGVC